jgi:hypothetical protein
MLGTPGQQPPPSAAPVPIHDRLSGGDPRTLHNVDEVVATVLSEPERLDELIACVLDGDDEVLRMRAGDALEKVCRARPWLRQPHASLLLGDMSKIHQRSVQWHVAQMLGHLRLTGAQRGRAVRLMSEDLDESTDWIVLSCSLDTLAVLARQDPAVIDDLGGQLRRHEHSGHRSLASRARRLRVEFGPDPAAPAETRNEGST